MKLLALKLISFGEIYLRDNIPWVRLITYTGSHLRVKQVFFSHHFIFG